MKSAEEWFSELQKLAQLANWPIGERDDWRECYDAGQTPEEALNEDISASRSW